MNAPSTPSDRSEGVEDPGGEPPTGPGYPLLLFRAGSFRGGVAVGRVREVVRLRRLARIPDGRPPFRGLLSVRGDIVTVVDLAGLQEIAAGRSLDLMDDTAGTTTGRIRPTRIDSVIVLRGESNTLGLEVDGVEDIHDFAPRPGEPTATPEATNLWASTVRGPMGDVGVLDVDAVLRMAESIAKGTEESPLLEVGDRG